jgi:pyruvate ferredoxin oxidoreductase beta subunit
VEDYLKPQKRFAHLFGKRANPAVLARLQAEADRNVRKFGLLADDEADDIPAPNVAAERANLV